jgi:type IX secretion system PorP/SprF family membrane protein
MLTCGDKHRTPMTKWNFRYLLPAALMAFTIQAARAQQELMISQYMFNGLFLNPAYAGSHPYTSATLLHRAQWVGIQGAPQTSLAGIDGPLLGGKMGLGLTISHDVVGVSHETEIAGNYAYRIRLGDGHLAFGLKAGLSLYSATLSDLTYWDTQDAVYQSNISNAAIGKFGFGVYWNNERSFIGLSVPTLYAADGKLASDIADAPDHYFTQHYFLNAGHVFDLSEDFDLKPSILLKYQPQAPPEVDLNCNVLYKKRLRLGVGYRTGDAVVAMLEFQINPMFRVGYSYDATTSELHGYNSGSHEVMLGIDLGKEPIAIKNPRFF